jgi:hypothetical protein
MHPEVRSDRPGSCRICGMRLVPIPPLSVAAYPVDFRVTKTVSGVRLRLTITHPSTRAVVRAFAVVHDKPMHLFVVGGSGLRVFLHEHPEPQRDGSFQIDLALPEAGAYMAFADFLPVGGSPQWFQQTFTTGSPLAPRLGEPADEPHASNGLRASIDASSVKSGGESALAFDVAEDTSGTPVADLEPYLGASAHLFGVSADLTEGLQAHPQDDRRGPRLLFSPIFPRAGRYKLWLQVQRAGRVATVPFVIDVR